MNNNKPHEEVTKKIIELLEKGVVPWHRPWKVEFPCNAATKKQYNGINIMMLDIERMVKGYTSNQWCTALQAKKLGGSVKAGQQPEAFVVFYKFFNAPGKVKDKIIPFMRLSNVYNIDQCEGLKLPAASVRVHEDIKPCEAVVENMPQRPEIEHGGNEACYNRRADLVRMPGKSNFDNNERYYSTLFHELIHSTGHHARLNRKELEESRFGNEPHSKEELIAEVGSAMLNNICGIDSCELMAQSAAYCKSWSKKFQDDKKMIIQAASAAQKAVDFILRNKKEE
jgi:antirestriction protein ArdC